MHTDQLLTCIYSKIYSFDSINSIDQVIINWYSTLFKNIVKLKCLILLVALVLALTYRRFVGNKIFCKKTNYLSIYICIYSGYLGRGFIVRSKGFRFYRGQVTREGFKGRGGGTQINRGQKVTERERGTFIWGRGICCHRQQKLNNIHYQYIQWIRSSH